jgi:serine/threonine protein kinase/formylglycine-generating enzyme required for sulfatase activity
MNSTPSDPPAPSGDSDDLLSLFFRRVYAGEGLDFDAFCREHPAEAAELRERFAALGRPSRESLPGGLTDELLNNHPDVPERPDGNAVEATQAATPAPPEDPSTIGPYRILSRLGKGGFGVVYLAEQSDPVRMKVAIKVLKRGMEPNALARFEAEGQALARMNHPHIARIFTAGSTGAGQPYFVMEYVAGETISRFVRDRALSVPDILRIFISVCDAVNHAHQRAAVLHRDLKPGNILVATDDEDGPVPKVIDFGLAKALEEPLTEESLHTGEAVLGTIEYMSPEQAAMTGAELDARTDVYSLGVVLYELLTGTLPIDSRTLRSGGFTEIHRIKRDAMVASARSRLLSLLREDKADAREYDRIQARLRDMHRDLDLILGKALEPDRTRRYATVHDLKDDIVRYLAGEAVTARPPSGLYRLRKFAGRHKAAAIAASAVFLSTAVLLTVTATASWIGKVNRVATHLEDGRGYWREHERHAEAARRIRTELERQEAAVPRWLPVWDRAEELRKSEEWERSRRDQEISFVKAELALIDGLNEPVGATRLKSDIRRLLAEIFYARYQEAIRTDGVRFHPEVFRIFSGEFAAASASPRPMRQRISLATDPPGARIHAFRFQPLEGRLYPYPFHPVRDVKEEAVIRVEEIFPAMISPGARPPFQPGDKLLEIRGRTIRSFTEMARAIEGIGEAEEVSIRVEREGLPVSSSWVPFPSAKVDQVKSLMAEVRHGPPESEKYERGYGCLLQPLLQFGVNFAAYPLERGDDNCVGESPVELDLPEGSYLFFLAKDGWEDARFPVTIPVEDRERSFTTKLARRGSGPEGFIYVPGGFLSTGGDSRAFNVLEPETVFVEGFYLARKEVTASEWFEFVNAPDILPRIDEDGMLEPRMPEVVQELRAIGGRDRIQVIPYDPDVFNDRWSRSKEGWGVGNSWYRKSWPILGVSHLAALEYIAWQNESAARGGKAWRYRLPTNVEWEKAARGTDRRCFPWGNHNVWSFSWNMSGNILRTPLEAGASPFDESVFGIRDMAGSAVEHIGEQVPGLGGNRYYRGGHWQSVDDVYLRSGSRHSQPSDWGDINCGLRLAASASSR